MDNSGWEHVAKSDCAESVVRELNSSITMESSKDATDVMKSVSFTVNGVEHVVTSSISPRMLLVDFIRDKVQAKGTKVLCREGGCGACTVVVTVPDPSIEDGGTRTFSVNACQVLIYACSGWAVETIESLGNRHTGYNDLQKSLVANYGTQCGYCSPGMVMAMYGAMKANGAMTSEDVEGILDGNICRCTGYRPIMDAFKAFAIDGPKNLKQRLVDIEEAYQTPCGKSQRGGQCKKACTNPCTKVVHSDTSINSSATSTVQWYEPLSLNGLCSVIKKSVGLKYSLVAGNTGSGVYKEGGPITRYISLSKIPELHKIEVTKSPISIGARVSLTACIKVFERIASDELYGIPGYKHLQEIADHWKLVANEAVRNVGSWAGNLMLRHTHREFPSDVSITLAACDVTIIVMDVNSKVKVPMSVTDLDHEDMTTKIIVSMSLPPLEQNTYVRTHKISRRLANAHTYVSSAVRISVDHNDGFKVTRQPHIFFTGIQPHFVSAARTTDYLTGKKLSDVTVVKGALQTLGAEVTPNEDNLQGNVEYRKVLALALLYKTIIWLMSDNLSPEYKSGGNKLTKSVTKSAQSFDENIDTWPLGQPVPKVESNVQVSGEAEYVDDIIPAVGELHGAFVQSSEANAKLESVDASEALAVTGVVSYISASDVPGYNSFVTSPAGGDDKVFATDRVQYAGQSIGLVVAETRDIAKEAAKLVKVVYSDVKKPILTIKDALLHGEDQEISEEVEERRRKASDGLKASANTIKGEMSIGSQFHFIMEPLCSRVVPIEDGYNVACTTQFITETQNVVSQVLGVPANSILMEVRRLGGGFGGKISRANLLACAAAVASDKLNKAVRITLDLQTHMSLVGWREPFYAAYEVGFTDTGKLQAVDLKIYSDTGFVKNDSSVSTAKYFAKNVYDSDVWNIEASSVTTDTAANTWCRTPGNVQGLAFIENIMEHVATHLNKDPLEIRELNLSDGKQRDKEGENKFKTAILPLLKVKSMLTQRKEQVTRFNSENKWRKRGISVIPFYYPFYFPSVFRYNAQIAIYEHDGTVAITHGGIEMGQGINTKVAQVAAHALGVPLSIVSVKPTNNVAGANAFVTGGSFASDLVAHGVSICCGRLNSRIEAVRKNIPKDKLPYTWPQLIKLCHKAHVDLSERYWTDPSVTPPGYDIYGGGCLEVEIDVLTGQFVTRRVDLIEDVGRSMSPLVDMGQIEGAFIMGVGMFTTEEVIFEDTTGVKSSCSSWDYKPPTALDIPEDFRVTFLPNASKTDGMLGSKATGEPPFCLTYVIVTALRQAIAAARKDGGVTGWFEMDTPLTVEKIHKLCYVKPIDQLM